MIYQEKKQMKFKVKTTSFIEATSWRDAEHIIEQQLPDADQIESEPISKSSTDLLIFAITAKVEDMHRKIYFDSNDDEEYKQKLVWLKMKTANWLDNVLNEVLDSNEELWS